MNTMMGETKRERRRKANELVQAIKEKLPAEYWEPFDLIIDDNNANIGLIVQLGEMRYYFDHRTGAQELMAARLDADGKEEAGSVLDDGTFAWGKVREFRVSDN